LRQQPNYAVEPTPDSLRSYVAAALGRGSPQAFGVGVPHHWQLHVISDNMILSFCKEDC